MAPDDSTLRFFDHTVDIVLIHTTPDGLITEWRGAAAQVFGYSTDEAIGMSLSAFFVPEDVARGLDVQEIAVARAQGRSEDDRWHLRRDGGRFWASGVLTAVRDEDGSITGLCKIMRDRTDTKTQLQSLENVTASLMSQREAGRRRISTLTHELRNSLMPMVTALALLQRPDAAHLAARATKTLAGQIDLLRHLVEDLDALTTDAAESLELQPEPVDLNLALTELVDAFLRSSQTPERRISLVLPKEVIWISADPARLQQILLNLLGNAVKYTSRGGRIDLNATIEGSMAVIRMEDDGIGISAEMLPRIFDLFTREGRSPDIEGKGVGLAIVKQLAAAHGGMIDVRSPGLNRGSTFSLRLPCCPGPPSGAG